MPVNKKRILNWIKIIVLIYTAIGIALYYLQETFLFHPQKIDRNYAYTFSQKFEEVNIAVNETDTINMVKFYPNDLVRKGVVLFFHGNKGNVIRFSTFINIFLKNGYEVWIEDYPSYGKSTGVLTEQKLYNQAMQIKLMADALYKTDSIIIYGKSLGTGVAAYVASKTKAKMLILETPYNSITSLAKMYAPIYPINKMMRYKFPTNEFLKKVNYPVSIFHGTADYVIPYSNAIKLKTVLKPTDIFVTIEGAGHNNVNSNNQYLQKIDSLLR